MGDLSPETIRNSLCTPHGRDKSWQIIKKMTYKIELQTSYNQDMSQTQGVLSMMMLQGFHGNEVKHTLITGYRYSLQ